MADPANNPEVLACVEVTQADRDAAADAVKAYRDQRNSNWQQRIRDGQCDDGEMVQAFARHRLASTPAAAANTGRAKVLEEHIEAALHAQVPGGSEVWAWLPQQDAWTPHQTARDVMRAALEAAFRALSTPTDATAVEAEREAGR